MQTCEHSFATNYLDVYICALRRLVTCISRLSICSKEDSRFERLLGSRIYAILHAQWADLNTMVNIRLCSSRRGQLFKRALVKRAFWFILGWHWIICITSVKKKKKEKIWNCIASAEKNERRKSKPDLIRNSKLLVPSDTSVILYEWFFFFILF